MKRWLAILSTLILATFSSIASAQDTPLISHWTNAGISQGFSIWIDLENIRPVSLPGESTPIPDMYYISTRFGNDPQEPIREESIVVDLRSGYVLPYIDGKSQNWTYSPAGASALVDFAYIYKNKWLIVQRTPHFLSQSEASFPDRNPIIPIDSEGWKTAFVNNKAEGKIKVDSIQVTAPGEGLYPGIFFVAQMNIKNADETIRQIRMQVELNPNHIPQQYRIFHVQIFDDSSNSWQSHDMAEDLQDGLHEVMDSDPISFLATSAYEYAITHSNEVENRGHFTFENP